MNDTGQMILGCVLAAALALNGCGADSSGSSGASEPAGSSSSLAETQNSGQRTGLGILTDTTAQGRTGKVHTVTAAVVLDREGRLEKVVLDELEVPVTAKDADTLTLPEDHRTKRQKGEEYPLAEVSSIGQGWTRQADAFGQYLTGKTAGEVRNLATDEEGRSTDPDLLTGCTIAVDRYRDAVLLACENAEPLEPLPTDAVAAGLQRMMERMAKTE